MFVLNNLTSIEKRVVFKFIEIWYDEYKSFYGG